MSKNKNLTIDQWIDRVVSRVEGLVYERRPEWLKNRDGGRAINQSAMSADSGIDQTTIGRLINKKHMPSMETLASLATALDVELPDLFIEKRISSNDPALAENPTYELFLTALDRLSEGEIEWLSDKMRKMLAAHQLMMEEPEIYDLIYSDKDRQKRRDAGRSLSKKAPSGQKSRKSA